MLHDTDYDRQLDAALDLVGNDLSALDRLNAALALMPDYDGNEWDDNPEWDSVVSLGAPSCREEAFDDASGYEPTETDWDDYCLYLDRLDAERDYPEIESPRWSVWLQWIRRPAELPVDDLEPSTF